MVLLWAKDKVMHSGLKILETIITEAFFLSGFTLTNIHDSQGNQPGKGEAISLTPHGGQTFLDKEFMGRLF